MKYSVDKKLDLRRFKKIVNDEIINVCDNYIEVVKKFDYKYIMDIHGKCLHVLSPFTFEIKYLGKGFFIKIQNPKLIPNIYKDDRIITGIKDVRFEDDNVVGITPYNQECLFDDSGTIISNDYIKIYKFSNSVAPVKLTTPEDKIKYGFINDLGKELIEPCYDDATEFHNHYAGVLLKNKWGIIDDNLNFVINPKIRCNNLFVVSPSLLLIRKKKNKIITDFSENIIYKLNQNEKVKMDYKNQVIYIYDSDYNRFDNVSNESDNILNLKIVNDCFRNNYKYTKIITSDYKEIDIRNLHIEEIHDDNIIVFTDNSYGVLSKEYTKSRKYNSIKSTCNNNYIVSNNNKYGIINREDEELLPLLYNDINYYDEGEYYVAKTDNENILLDKELRVINRFESDEEIVEYKNNLIVIKHNNQYCLLDSEFNEIVSSNNRIYILNDNKVILENHLIDLNDEYIDLIPVYELSLKIDEHCFSATFRTKEKLDECIKQIEEIETNYKRKEIELNQQLELLKNEIDNTGKEKIKEINRIIK